MKSIAILFLFLISMDFLYSRDREKLPVHPAESSRIAIDPGRVEFDTEAQFSFLPDSEKGWAIWKSYRLGHEKVLARKMDLGRNELGNVIELTGGIEAAFGLDLELPENSGTEKLTLVARWSEFGDDGKWRIAEHYLPGRGGARKFEIEDGMRSHSSDGNFVFQKLTNPGKSDIFWKDSNSKLPKLLKNMEGAGIRMHPKTVTDAEGSMWVFWDEYKDGARWISAKNLSPKAKSSVEIVSPMDGRSRCLNPVPIRAEQEGLCVVWIKLADTIGGEGVIDMIHTAHVAFQNPEGKWTMVTDESGSDVGATMLNGLLPDFRPKKGYPSGYSGNRRKPMLLDAGADGVWMVWERKSAHSGGGTRTAGQLLGRRFKNGNWIGKPVVLHEGLTDYRLASPRKTMLRPRASGEDGAVGSLIPKMFVIGSEIPHSWKRPSYIVELDPARATAIELDDWSDQFKPVALPYPEKERYTTEVVGKKFKLFWGDLHCHSGLTGDAEGEPDEIVLYGRDRAKLDVMVLQDNDEVHGRILTDGEYRMGATHSQWITEPGRFIALPGYEWTQRTTMKGVPYPYQSVHEQKFSAGFPNHRTVIYPMKGGPIIRYYEVGHQFKVMADRVMEAGGILHSQHPAFHISDHPAETNLEVTACWGIYIRNVPEKFHSELDKGRRMGFIGTSDSHRRNPGLCGGLTGIYAEELTPEAILDALKAHRVFATNGSKIVLDSRANDLMADEIVGVNDGKVSLSLHVDATKSIEFVRLIGTGGKTIAKFDGNDSETGDFSHEISDLKKGDHWFYWTVQQAGSSRQYSGNISLARGNLAWSSPHIVKVK